MVQENIDILHRVVIEAKDRKAKGNIGKDVWQEDLEPRAAVCGRTVPILEQEAKRLRESLAAVCNHVRECISCSWYSTPSRWRKRTCTSRLR